MPTEAELRQRLHDEGLTPIDTTPIDGRPIDTATVIRLSRRRRLPKRIAVGATVTLAVVGIGVAGISGISGLRGMTASDSAGGRAESAAGDGIVRAPAVGPDGCGAAPTASDPVATGLEIRTDFPDTVPADGEPVTGSVTILNTGSTRLTGTTPAPGIAILRDGIVVGYSGEQTPVVAVALDLGPGGEMRYETSFTAVGCGGSSGDRSMLEPGPYVITAVIDVTADIVGSTSTPNGSVVLTAPGEPIAID